MQASDGDRPEPDGHERTRRGVLRALGVLPLAAGETVDRVGPESPESDGAPAARADRPQGSFDPAVHGFGFPNWFGESGCAVEAEDCPAEREFTVEYEPPTLPEVQESIDSGWRVTPPAAQTELIARIVRYLAAHQLATNGHCYGMTLAAEAYQAGEAGLPDPAAVASDVPEPAGQYEPVGRRIRDYHTDQLLDSSGFWLSLFALEFGREDAAASVEQATAAIDETGTAVLTFGGLEAGHQVLAYDHVAEDGDVRFLLYDPEDPAEAYAGDDGPASELVADGETGELEDSPYDFEAWLYNDVEPDLGALDRLVGGTDELFGRLDSAVFLQVRAPFDLEVDVPDGTTAVPLGPSGDLPTGDVGDGVLLLDADVGEYALEVVGDADEEYSLEAFGLADGEVVIDEAVTGANGDSVERFVLAVEDTGGATLRSVSEDVAEGGDRLLDDRWLVAAGGALAAGLGLGVARRRLAGRSGDDG